MLYLKALNEEDAKEEYTFFQSIQSEHGFINDYYGISYEDFVARCIPERLNASIGINLPDGWVPDTNYFLWEDHIIIGLFRVRHYLNEALAQGAGHIGYGIHPAYRGRGFATKGLHLIIQECKNFIKEDELYLSCWKNNPASLHVQKHNGAYIHHEDENEYYTRIKLHS